MSQSYYTDILQRRAKCQNIFNRFFGHLERELQRRIRPYPLEEGSTEKAVILKTLFLSGNGGFWCTVMLFSKLTGLRFHVTITRSVFHLQVWNWDERMHLPFPASFVYSSGHRWTDGDVPKTDWYITDLYILIVGMFHCKVLYAAFVHFGLHSYSSGLHSSAGPAVEVLSSDFVNCRAAVISLYKRSRWWRRLWRFQLSKRRTRSETLSKSRRRCDLNTRRIRKMQELLKWKHSTWRKGEKRIQH